MSCPKLRSRLPDIAAAVSCDCRFDPQAGLYPTPLLHLQSLPLRAGAGIAGGIGGAQSLGRAGPQVERLVTDLYRLRADIQRSERLAAQLEARLRQLLEEQGVEELVTAAGTLRLDRRSGSGGTLSLLLPGSSSPGVGGVKSSVNAMAAADVRPLPREREASDGRALRDRAGSNGEPGAGAPAGQQGA